MTGKLFRSCSRKIADLPEVGNPDFNNKKARKMILQTGVYQHFKGKYYLVIGEATHSETEERMVVYQPLYGEQRWFVRPVKMFLEMVELDGATVQRFRWVGGII